MPLDEEDREVLTFEDVAELMYSTEVTQQCYPPPPEMAGVQPPDDKIERTMTVEEWISRGLAVNSLPREYVPGLSLEGLTWIIKEVELIKPEVFARLKEDLEHFKQVVAEGYDSEVRGVGLAPTVSPNFCAEGRLLRPSFLVLHKWIRSGFVAGPFQHPPFEDPKIIGLLFVPKEESNVRIIMDMSRPEGLSFNDGIDESFKIRYNLKIDSAGDVLERIRQFGPGCWISKLDVKDAYKMYALHPSQWRLQCFSFFGLHFCDYRMIFGDKKAVHVFSFFHHLIIKAAVLPFTALKDENFLLCIDDLTVVVGEHQLEEGRKFVERYQFVMATIGFKLQEFDPRKLKSFDFSRAGLVLGVFINIPRMTWHFVEPKTRKWLLFLENIIREGEVKGQIRLEQLMGRLENLVCLLPELTMKVAMTRNILSCPRNWRGKLGPAETLIRWVRALMLVFRSKAISFSSAAKEPRQEVTIFGDSSGALFSNYKPCAGALMETEEGGKAIALALPSKFLQTAFGGGALMAHRTGVLELLPALSLILLQPHRFKNKRITVVTDNMDLVISWARQRSRDTAKLALMQGLQLCCRMLDSDLTFRWQKRCSDKQTRAADELSHGDLKAAEELLPTGIVTHCAWPPPLELFMAQSHPLKLNFSRLVEEYLMEYEARTRGGCWIEGSSQ